MPIRLQWVPSRSEPNTFLASFADIFVFELSLSVGGHWMLYCPQHVSALQLGTTAVGSLLQKVDRDKAFEWAEMRIHTAAGQLYRELGNENLEKRTN